MFQMDAIFHISSHRVVQNIISVLLLLQLIVSSFSTSQLDSGFMVFLDYIDVFVRTKDQQRHQRTSIYYKSRGFGQHRKHAGGIREGP